MEEFYGSKIYLNVGDVRYLMHGIQVFVGRIRFEQVFPPGFA